MVEHQAEVHQATSMISLQAGVGMAEALVPLRARAYAIERTMVAWPAT